MQEESEGSGEITFYDSNTGLPPLQGVRPGPDPKPTPTPTLIPTRDSGKPLFYGPRDRSWSKFVKESQVRAERNPRPSLNTSPHLHDDV